MTTDTVPTRRVSILLGIGIFLFPIIFAWFTLRQGYSTVARVITFGWLILIMIVVVNGPKTGPKPAMDSVAQRASQSAPSIPAKSTDNTVTASKYERLRTGMTYEEAVEIIGFEGEELSSTDMAGYKTVMVAWKNWDGTNMNAMFQNGRLVTKAQFGLR